MDEMRRLKRNVKGSVWGTGAGKGTDKYQTLFSNVFLISLTLLLGVCVLNHSVMSKPSVTLCSLPGSSLHEDSWSKNTEMGCHFLQGILLTKGSNPISDVSCSDRGFLHHYCYLGSSEGLICVSLKHQCEFTQKTSSNVLKWNVRVMFKYCVESPPDLNQDRPRRPCTASLFSTYSVLSSEIT